MLQLATKLKRVKIVTSLWNLWNHAEPCYQVATKSSIKQPLITVKSGESPEKVETTSPRKPLLRVDSSYLSVNQGVAPIGVDDKDLGLTPKSFWQYHQYLFLRSSKLSHSRHHFHPTLGEILYLTNIKLAEVLRLRNTDHLPVYQCNTAGLETYVFFDMSALAHLELTMTPFHLPCDRECWELTVPGILGLRAAPKGCEGYEPGLGDSHPKLAKQITCPIEKHGGKISPSNGTDQEPLGVRTVTHFIGIPGVPPAAFVEFAASVAHENQDYVEGLWKSSLASGCLKYPILTSDFDTPSFPFQPLGE